MKITKEQYYAFIAFVERAITVGKELESLRRHGLEYIGVVEDSDEMWNIEELFYGDSLDIKRLNNSLRLAKIEVVE